MSTKEECCYFGALGSQKAGLVLIYRKEFIVLYVVSVIYTGMEVLSSSLLFHAFLASGRCPSSVLLLLEGLSLTCSKNILFIQQAILCLAAKLELQCCIIIMQPFEGTLPPLVTPIGLISLLIFY